MDALIPWTPRRVRKAAIDRARSEKETSRRAASEAAQVEAAIRELAARNHFAAAIVRQIASGSGGGDG